MNVFPFFMSTFQGRGEGVALWGSDAGSTPPELVVRPKEGCPSQNNYWGGGKIAQSEGRSGPAPPSPPVVNKTVLRPCRFGVCAFTMTFACFIFRYSALLYILQLLRDNFCTFCIRAKRLFTMHARRMLRASWTPQTTNNKPCGYDMI